MNDERLIWEKYLGMLNEKRENKVWVKNISEFTQEQKDEILSKLSDVERSQLGTPAGGTSARSYMSEDDWVLIRDYTLRKALEKNPDTNPELCAYTPAETLKLLDHPIVKNWFKMVERFKIPENKEKVIFVSCAASKRWGENTKSQDYQCYNIIRKRDSKIYWVTISEPLAIIPEDHWDDFPFYDNPGLFKDRGIATKEWIGMMGKQGSYLYPFDVNAKRECINILGNVIKNFYEFNKKLNPNLEFKSAVETRTEKSTHSEMLDVAGILQNEQRFFKAKKLSTKEDRMAHWDTISNFN